ncbi:MAG: ribose 5-phosphate isomerase B [Oscillospiraceae bacterium]|nr:ribose 5-phosphate isomerase B [Oscillospiraceae bacterium]
MFTRLYIANDHGGLVLKNALLKHLAEKGYEVENLGSDTAETVRYPYYAARVARNVLDNPGAGGIIICSTGIGVSIIANKFKGIRAALCTSGFMAKATRMHNDSNILCLGGRVTGEYEAYDIVDNWLSSEFEGGRHNISLDLIRGAEDEMLNEGDCGLCHIAREDEE